MNMKFRWPRRRLDWLCFGIIIVVISIGLWPIIPLFNHETLVLGLPLLMVWSIAILVITTAAMVAVNFILGDRE